MKDKKYTLGEYEKLRDAVHEALDQLSYEDYTARNYVANIQRYNLHCWKYIEKGYEIEERTNEKD